MALIPAAALAILLLWGPGMQAIRTMVPAEAQVREYVTGPGERLTLTLEDETTVILSQLSRLRVSPQREAATRQIQLEGFALFDVAPDSARPFVVRMGSAVTRVLGTRFIVRAYPQESTIAVAVVEGRVAVVADTTARGGTALSGGQVAQLNRDGILDVIQDEGEVNRYLRMAQGRLHFIDRPLSEVLDELESIYPVRFEVSDSSLARQPLTIRVSGEHRLDEVMSAIALAMQARIERQGDTVTLSPLPRATAVP